MSRALSLVTSVALVVVPSVARAHAEHLGRNVYLSVGVDAVRVEQVVSVGARVADGVVAEIDANADGGLSHDEWRTYAARMGDALHLTVAGHPVVLHLAEAQERDVALLRTGEAAVTFVYEAALPETEAGAAPTTVNVFAEPLALPSPVEIHAFVVPESGVVLSGTRHDPATGALAFRYAGSRASAMLRSSPPRAPAPPVESGHARWAAPVALAVGLAVPTWLARRRVRAPRPVA